MRLLCLIGWLALASGCSSFGVRCDSRLRPINPRQAQVNPVKMPEGAVVPSVAASVPGQSVRP